MKYIVAACLLLTSLANAQTVEQLDVNREFPSIAGYNNDRPGAMGVVSYTIPSMATYVKFVPAGTNEFYGCADAPNLNRCAAGVRPTGNVSNGTAWERSPRGWLITPVSNTVPSVIYIDPASTTAVQTQFYR